MLDSKQRDGIDDEQLSIDAMSIGAETYMDKRNRVRSDYEDSKAEDTVLNGQLSVDDPVIKITNSNNEE